ncbi:MAG: nucleoside deaminase [Bryobacterales bacterium]|nr:nucleoside deaminase [Bryobacterales bacterium]
MNTPEEFLRLAIRLAEENVASARGGPFAAVIARDDQVIATGVNLVTSTHDPTAHAEVVAIREACRVLGRFQLKGCAIYSSCEPCPMCLGAIYWARPARLYFAASRHDAAAAGFDDAFLYQEIAAPLEARRIPTAHLLENEAGSPFDAWRAKLDRIAY